MSEVITCEHIRVTEEEDGRLLRITLARPKANILDAAMLGEIRRALEAAAERPTLRAVLLDHEGPHFSFGASVQEHLPDQVEDMIRGFHGFFRDAVQLAVPFLAAVRGHALGAGLEVASFCQRLFVAPDAVLGQPEIKLAVFAPVASVILPPRIGQGRSDDILLSGRNVGAEEALACGLADELADDPAGAALEWFRKHLADKSAAALRHAVRAARADLHARLSAQLDEVEALYLRELMSTRDALEGLQAFLEKRAPRWSDQ